MPQIAYNGQLYEITQAQYDTYTVGGPLPTGAVLANPSNVAGGGNVTVNNSTTSTILTQNTTNNTPGQALTTTTVNVNTTSASTNYGTSTQTFDDGTTLQTFDDGSVLATGTDGSITSSPAPTETPQTLARAGLTADQLTLLGAADATDPYIRARLGLPALSEVQTLSGAIGNVNFGNVGNAVGNLVTSFGNTVGNISFSDIGNTVGNLASSFGNTISNVGDYFSGNTSTTVAESAVNTTATATDAGTTTQTFDDGTTLQTFDDGSVLATGTDGSVTTTDAPVDSTVDPQASLAAGETIVPVNQIDVAPADTNFGTTTQTFDDGSQLQTFDDGSVLATATDGSLTATDAPVDNTTDYYASPDAVTVVSGTGEGAGSNTAAADSAGVIQGLTGTAQSQQTFAIQRRQVNNADWRVRLRLAPQSTYLYNAPQPGILKPLKVTDGIVFPYTPSINTSYRAQYTPYDLTHSNYRGYWYSNSYTDAVQVNAMFTAQDTNEANYLLAVIHFLRSATKMFYGQDAERGSPPPVCYLSGLGEYQFKEHACLISQFTYNLPADCDYIRAGSPNQVGLNLVNLRDRQDVATNSIFGQLNRLANAFLNKGGINQPPAPPTLGLNSPAYVPTKMEIQLTLYPIQSRNQVSKQFSLKGFANGDLIKGGFW
jgi:hypothetical protein